MLSQWKHDTGHDDCRNGCDSEDYDASMEDELHDPNLPCEGEERGNMTFVIKWSIIEWFLPNAFQLSFHFVHVFFCVKINFNCLPFANKLALKESSRPLFYSVTFVHVV